MLYHRQCREIDKGRRGADDKRPNVDFSHIAGLTQPDGAAAAHHGTDRSQLSRAIFFL